MKIVTIIGTRPEIIKMSPLLDKLNKMFTHILVHSGQHYDANLDTVLFRELKLPPPNFRLKTGGGTFAIQISKQLKSIEKILVKEQPQYVIVQGDTNTALSGAIVAARLGIGVIHIEAGCRSGNLSAPEEQNRILIDSIARLRLCADKKSFQNLIQEAKSRNSVLVGSTTFDAVKRTSKIVKKDYFPSLGLKKEKYVLATLHRAESMEDLQAFKAKIDIIDWVSQMCPVVFPIHPRTKKFLKMNNIKLSRNVLVIEPLGNLHFINLLKNSLFMLSDSGGVQEEAAAFDRPCFVLRGETEWTRLIRAGKNFLVPKLDTKIKVLMNRMINDKAFYQSIRKKKCNESVTGATKNIIREIKALKKIKL